MNLLQIKNAQVANTEEMKTNNNLRWRQQQLHFLNWKTKQMIVDLNKIKELARANELFGSTDAAKKVKDAIELIEIVASKTGLVKDMPSVEKIWKAFEHKIHKNDLCKIHHPLNVIKFTHKFITRYKNKESKKRIAK
jgi:hypothetical protein